MHPTAWRSLQLFCAWASSPSMWKVVSFVTAKIHTTSNMCNTVTFLCLAFLAITQQERGKSLLLRRYKYSSQQHENPFQSMYPFLVLSCVKMQVWMCVWERATCVYIFGFIDCCFSSVWLWAYMYMCVIWCKERSRILPFLTHFQYAMK